MMMIRSQDRKMLLPIGKLFISKLHKECVRIILDSETVNSQNWTLGEYDSEQRCIKILDEIQKEYCKYLSCDGGPSLIQGGDVYQPFAFTPPKVYEMPEK